MEILEPLAMTPEAKSRFWRPAALKRQLVKASFPFEVLVHDAKGGSLGWLLMRIFADTQGIVSVLGGGYKSRIRLVVLERESHTPTKVYSEAVLVETFPYRHRALAAGGAVALTTYRKLTESGISYEDYKKNARKVALRWSEPNEKVNPRRLGAPRKGAAVEVEKRTRRAHRRRKTHVAHRARPRNPAADSPVADRK